MDNEATKVLNEQQKETQSNVKDEKKGTNVFGQGMAPAAGAAFGTGAGRDGGPAGARRSARSQNGDARRLYHFGYFRSHRERAGIHRHLPLPGEELRHTLRMQESQGMRDGI